MRFFSFRRRHRDGSAAAGDAVAAGAYAPSAVAETAVIEPEGAPGALPDAVSRGGAEEPAPDGKGEAPDVATDAATDTAAGAATDAAPDVAADVDESGIPRWRRASLLAARKSARQAEAPIRRLTFEHGTAAPVEGIARSHVRYRLVELLAEPDEVRSASLGLLDRGDEVQVLEASGAFRRVLCPDGREGWVHRMTLEETEETGSADA